MFYAIWHDVDTEPQVLGDSMTAIIPYTQQQYVWSNGKLYEEVELDCSSEVYWEETTVEVEVDFLHTEAKALGFFAIPDLRTVF